MATLICNSIYTTLNQNLDYVKSAHSTIPQEEFSKVNHYVTGDHANILFAKSYNCSLNPDLAAEQMLADRERYMRNRKNKNKKLPGQSKDKEEVLAHHFYLSLHQCDNISIEELIKINEEIFTKAGIIGNHRMITAPHVNTDELHIHSSVNAYHMKKQKKFCMNNKQRYKLWAIADYVCVQHGLSIVENPKLLKRFPEYRVWFEKVKAEGKVIIHPYRNVRQKAKSANERVQKKQEAKKQGNKTKSIWKPEQEIAKEFYDHLLREKEEEEERKKKATRYYDKRYPSHYHKNRYYSTSLYSPSGRKRGVIELTFILAGVAFFGMNFEGSRPKNYDRRRRDDNVMYFKIDKKAQAMMDNMLRARRLGCDTPNRIQERLADCGRDMNSLKEENKRLQKIIDLKSTDLETRAAAELKIEKNAERRKELNKDYRELKRLEAAYNTTMRPSFTSQFYKKPPEKELLPEEPEQPIMVIVPEVHQEEEKDEEQPENEKTAELERKPAFDDMLAGFEKQRLEKAKNKEKTRTKDKEKDPVL